MRLRVIYDTSAILAQMTPAPQDGSILWHWLETGVVEVILSDYLVRELRAELETPRFNLNLAARTTFLLEYAERATLIDPVPESGTYCRDPKDVPVLDLAIHAGVDAIVALDPDLLELDGQHNFRILRPMGVHRLLHERAD